MARLPITPMQAQAQARRSLQDSIAAATLALAIIDGTDNLSDAARRTTLANGAKTLEAAGCYMRRQHAKALLVP